MRINTTVTWWISFSEAAAPPPAWWYVLAWLAALKQTHTQSRFIQIAGDGDGIKMFTLSRNMSCGNLKPD